MTTVDDVRKAALDLPGVEEGTHFGMVSFSVRGRGFASVTQDDAVQLHMPPDDAEHALTAHPTAERLVRMGRPIGIRVPLADLDAPALNVLVHAAWRSRAPKSLRTRPHLR